MGSASYQRVAIPGESKFSTSCFSLFSGSQGKTYTLPAPDLVGRRGISFEKMSITIVWECKGLGVNGESLS